MLSRRHVLQILALAGPAAIAGEPEKASLNLSKALRVRTITAGIELDSASQLDRIERAIALLQRGRKYFEAAGYEVQTTRIATNAFLAALDPSTREKQLPALEQLDRMAAEAGVIVSVGPLLTDDRRDESLAAWSAELVRRTRTISFSVDIASSTVHGEAAMTAAQMMAALSISVADGLGNFRFAAAANIPAGTPFFPVAWHRGAGSVAIGLEAASVVEDAFRSVTRAELATDALRSLMTQALKPVEELGMQLAERERCRYLGIDSSPAPLKDRSIAAAIEALTGKPFGSASTLQACSIITAAIKSLDVQLCGYSGLMLPVLEDPLLAQRAGEGRYGIRDLLLYSSVCGTGLDVVPIPGDTPVEAIAGLLRDVAALSVRLDKALSARLFLVPGKKAGDIARFDDPLLTDCRVMKLD